MQFYSYFCILFLNFCTNNFSEKSTQQDFKNHSLGDSLTKIRITAVGDLMCHSTQYKYAQKSDGTYNFNPVYEEVKNYLSQANLTMGNIETVLAGNTTSYSGYPAFNTPNAYADALKEAGFDALITTNNHSYDQLEAGVLRTLDQLQERKIVSIGTFRSPEDRDSIRIFDVKGIKIAILAYTQFSNIGVQKKYLVNHIDSALITKDIKKSRAKGAELVIVNFHWGNEYQREPAEYQRMIARFTVEMGADAIIAHHPHVLQPVAKIKKKDNKNGIDSAFVAYSLGNFVSNQRWRYSDAGVIISLNITKNLKTNTLAISPEYLPTWVFKGNFKDGERRYMVLPSAAIRQNARHILPTLPYLTAKDRQEMKVADTDTKELLARYGVKMQEAAWYEDVSLKSLPTLQAKFLSTKINFLTIGK